MTTYINCTDCWKRIELKNNRTRCIRCSNKRDREIARQRRATQESKEYFKEYKKRQVQP